MAGNQQPLQKACSGGSGKQQPSVTLTNALSCSSSPWSCPHPCVPSSSLPTQQSTCSYAGPCRGLCVLGAPHQGGSSEWRAALKLALGSTGLCAVLAVGQTQSSPSSEAPSSCPIQVSSATAPPSTQAFSITWPLVHSFPYPFSPPQMHQVSDISFSTTFLIALIWPSALGCKCSVPPALLALSHPYSLLKRCFWSRLTQGSLKTGAPHTSLSSLGFLEQPKAGGSHPRSLWLQDQCFDLHICSLPLL